MAVLLAVMAAPPPDEERPVSMTGGCLTADLNVRPDGSVQGRISVYCFVRRARVRQEGERWIAEKGAGWIGCGPVPGDCISGK